MRKIPVAEFFTRLISFREKAFSWDPSPKERAELLESINFAYLNVDQDDPDFSESVATLFDSTIVEYVMRMRLMGISLQTV